MSEMEIPAKRLYTMPLKKYEKIDRDEIFSLYSCCVALTLIRNLQKRYLTCKEHINL